MPKEKKPKRCHYRFVDGFKEGRTLEDLLREVLFTTHAKVSQRWQMLDGDSPETKLHMLINTRRRSSGMVFGTLVLYEAGRNREALALADEQEELEVEQIAASEPDDERRREFLEATLYFGVSGNHMMLMQTRALTSRELENHLRWLLAEQAQVLQREEHITLKQGVSVKGTKALQRPKEIRIGAPAFQSSLGEPGELGSSGAEGRSSMTLGEEMGRRVLNSLFDEEALKNLGLDRFNGADDLRVEVVVKRVGRGRAPGSELGRRALQTVTEALRHQHPDDLEVDAEGMGKVKGEEIHLSKPLRVVHWNGVPDYEDAFHRMEDWFEELLENGTIS